VYSRSQPKRRIGDHDLAEPVVVEVLADHQVVDQAHLHALVVLEVAGSRQRERHLDGLHGLVSRAAVLQLGQGGELGLGRGTAELGNGAGDPDQRPHARGRPAGQEHEDPLRRGRIGVGVAGLLLDEHPAQHRRGHDALDGLAAAVRRVERRAAALDPVHRRRGVSAGGFLCERGRGGRREQQGGQQCRGEQGGWVHGGSSGYGELWWTWSRWWDAVFLSQSRQPRRSSECVDSVTICEQHTRECDAESAARAAGGL
jgi:hypothetical protein